MLDSSSRVDIAVRLADLSLHTVHSHDVDILRKCRPGSSGNSGASGTSAADAKKSGHGAHQVRRPHAGIRRHAPRGRTPFRGGLRDGGDLRAVDQFAGSHSSPLSVTKHDLRHLAIPVGREDHGDSGVDDVPWLLRGGAFAGRRSAAECFSKICRAALRPGRGMRSFKSPSRPVRIIAGSSVSRRLVAVTTRTLPRVLEAVQLRHEGVGHAVVDLMRRTPAVARDGIHFIEENHDWHPWLIGAGFARRRANISR